MIIVDLEIIESISKIICSEEFQYYISENNLD